MTAILVFAICWPFDLRYNTNLSSNKVVKFSYQLSYRGFWTTYKKELHLKFEDSRIIHENKIFVYVYVLNILRIFVDIPSSRAVLTCDKNSVLFIMRPSDWVGGLMWEL